MTGKDVLPQKDLLEKAAAIKRFEFSLLGKGLKMQTSVTEKQYQSFDKDFNHDEKEEPVKIKKEGRLKTDDSSLVCNKRYSLSEFKNVGKYEDESLTTRFDNMVSFNQRLKEFKKFTP